MDISDFRIASVNPDGTYGEPKKLSNVKEISFSMPDPEETVPADYLIGGEYSGTIKIDNVPEELMNEIRECLESDHRKLMFENWQETVWDAMCLKRGCITCRNCKEEYHYPGFVDAEECICEAGEECDTFFGRKENCSKYIKREWDEPMKRNPDLDKYMYVIK